MVLGWDKMRAPGKTRQQMADEAEALAGQGMVKKAAETLSTRKTRSRIDALEEEALSEKPKRKKLY